MYISTANSIRTRVDHSGEFMLSVHLLWKSVATDLLHRSTAKSKPPKLIGLGDC